MRLSSRKNKGGSVEMQMTSMIDVTFLLLIFFMATSSFVKAERELNPNIKVNKPAATKTTSHVEPAIIDIVRGEGGFVYKLGGREFKSADELLAVLRQLENKGEGAFVRADDAAPFDMAATAIQTCKSAGFIGVSYVPRDE
jgi:biopolymer transport protein ExbD